MTTEIQDQFRGIAPAISPKKLSESLAQVAENTRFDGGKLRPFRAVADHQNVPDNTSSIHYANPTDEWLVAINSRSYVRPFLPADQYGFTYYTDGQKPMYRVEGSALEYDAGIDRPAAPTLSVDDSGDQSNPLTLRNQSYVICWVDGHDRVGPTSLPSSSVTVGEGGQVTVNRPALPSTQWYADGARWRVFRSNTGSTNVADYQYVAEAAISSSSLTDAYEPDELTYVAFSDLWVGPPDSLKGLALAAGDSLVGYTKNEVYASEPRVPYAWPYSWGFQEQVRGLAAINGGVFVATDGQPWLLAGSDPNNMQKVPIESDAACVSADSLVDMGGSAIYAGRAGLYLAQGSSVVNLTESAFDEEHWAAYQPSTIRAFKYEQFYVGFYGNPSDGTGFIYDPAQKNFSTLTVPGILAGHFNPYDEKTYVLYEDGIDRRIGVFNEGSLLVARWRSRLIIYPDRVNLSSVRIEADSYPITLRVWSDGELQTVTIEDSRVHKLEAGFKAKRWEFEVEGTPGIDMICLADSAGSIV